MLCHSCSAVRQRLAPSFSPTAAASVPATFMTCCCRCWCPLLLLQRHDGQQGFPGAGADCRADGPGQGEGPPGQVRAALCMLCCAGLRCARHVASSGDKRTLGCGSRQLPAAQPVHVRCPALYRIVLHCTVRCAAGCSPWRSWRGLTSMWSRTTPAARWASLLSKYDIACCSPATGVGSLVVYWPKCGTQAGCGAKWRSGSRRGSPF